MKRTASSIAMTAALLMANPAFATTAGYIKFDGVDGEAATEVALDGWSFGACQSGRCSTVASPRDQASGMASGKRTKEPLAASGQSTQSQRTGVTKLTASQNSQSLRGGVNVAAGDLDGDGRADLAFAGTVPEVSSLTLHFDKASPVLARVCAGKHIAKAELGRGADTMVIEHATVTCSSGAATRTTQGATFGERSSVSLPSAGPVSMTFTSGKIITRTGHVTLMK